MASAENQEQPAANQPSANSAKQESLEQQESVVTPPENITVNSESLTEEVSQVQPEIAQKNNEPSSSVIRSPSYIADEEKKTESTSSQVTTEAVANSSQKDEYKDWWDVILDEIRSFLPESMNKSLSDWALTAIVSSLIVLILSISVLLLPSRASGDLLPESTEMVSIPEQEIEITIDSTPTEKKQDTATPADSSETVSIPEQEIEITIDSTPTEETEKTDTLSDSSKTVSIPEQEIEITIDSTSTEEKEETETSSEISTPVEIETPKTLVAPKKPESLTVKTTPPPQPVLTPEQNLLNAVQEKVSKITNQYSDDLIVSGEVDLLSRRLLIKVNDDWYKLNKSRQDEFANETFKSSQKFNFNKLEIQDMHDNIIARSPVVGNKMIILQRTN